MPRTLPDLNSFVKEHVSEEVKKVIEYMQAEFVKVRAQLTEDFSLMFGAKLKEVEELKNQVQFLTEKVSKLEDLVDEADQYERRDCLILSGPAVPAASSGENCASIVQDTIKNCCNIVISPTDINTAHRLGKKPISQGPDRRSLIVKFCRRDIKQDIYRSSRTQSRPKQLYINESLSPMRQKLYKSLRQMRKNHPDLVAGCSTFDGNLFAYTKMPPRADGSNTKDRRHLIKNLDSLKKFCEEHVKTPIDTFLSSWNQSQNI